MKHMKASMKLFVLGVLGLALTSCGDQTGVQSQVVRDVFSRVSTSLALTANTTPSSATTDNTSPVGYYAAARFLDQASWGATPQAISEVRSLGFSAWIDKQLALTPTLTNPPNYVIDYTPDDGVTAPRALNWINIRFFEMAASGQDQLRQRVSWAFYNFIPSSNGYAIYRLSYYDFLQKNSLSTFPQLLKAVTLSPSMGYFLNNKDNTASSPNENYGREVMQLFSVGLVQLNMDGTVKRDANGVPLQTYSQADVINSTKALTGWGDDWNKNLPQTNGCNCMNPEIPKVPTQHDFSAKTILGTSIPANQTIQQDLDSFIGILTKHPNTAPFVSRRLIQNMVSSDPSPEYIARVAKVFVDSGADLSKVVKAILLDPEARAGDDPAQQSNRVGKIKEPVLIRTSLMRGLSCKTTILSKSDSTQADWAGQDPINAPTVFGYFSPDYKTPVTLTNLPEQSLMNLSILNNRNSLTWNLTLDNLQNAGCDISPFITAVQTSNQNLIQLFSERFFRGRIPTALANGINTLLANDLANETPFNKVFYLLGLLISSSAFGVV
jgi:uncharacterized protein (DUF1800 family)